MMDKKLDSNELVSEERDRLLEVYGKVLADLGGGLVLTKYEFVRQYSLVLKVFKGERDLENWKKTLSEKALIGLVKFMDKRPGSVILVGFGDVGRWKVWFKNSEGEIRKVWFYDKYGWSEA